MKKPKPHPHKRDWPHTETAARDAHKAWFSAPFRPQIDLVIWRCCTDAVTEELAHEAWNDDTSQVHDDQTLSGNYGKNDDSMPALIAAVQVRLNPKLAAAGKKRVALGTGAQQIYSSDATVQQFRGGVYADTAAQQ